MKPLHPDLRISTTPEGSFIVTSGSSYFSVSEQTAKLLQIMQNSSTGQLNKKIAQDLSSELGFDVLPQDVDDAINALPLAFFSPVQLKNRFTWSLSLLDGRLLHALARVFSTFFYPLPAFLLLSLSAYALWLTNERYTVVTPTTPLAPALALLSIVFHEIGHAAASHRGGARPSVIGLGFEGLIPTFYTDVSDIWSRGRWARIRVDIGGIYFQILYAAVLTPLVSWNVEILAAINLIILLAAFSCLPYFKFDGYWLLGDVLNKNNLDMWLKENATSIYNKIKTNSFGFSDYRISLFLFAYYSGLAFIVLWGIYSAYRLFCVEIKSLNNIRAETFDLSSFPYALSISIILISGIFLKKILVFLNSIKEFRFLFIDVPLILRALLMIFFLKIGRSFLGITNKHNKYLKAVSNGLKKVSPAINNIGKISKSNLISKYYELIWFEFLNKVSMATGLWIVRITHRTRSTRTMGDIVRTPGPIILAAPHFGSFISGAMCLLSEVGSARPVHLLYADPATDPNNGRYEAFYRKFFPSLSVCFNNKHGIIKAAKALRRGEILVIMPDVFPGEDLIPISLLGCEIHTMTGISYFSQKFGATIIPVISRFSGLVSIDIHVGDAIKFAPNQLNEADSNIKIMENLFDNFSNWFLKYPQDWHCWEKFGHYAVPITKC